MARHSEHSDRPWYRTTAATVAAGGVGAGLLAALVYTVVQFSDDWTNPAPTMLTTAGIPPPAPTTQGDRQPFVITPTDTSTTFSTSVSVSTTDIGVPTALTPTTSTTTATTTTTDAGGGEQEPTTTRKRPRLNETRTLSP